jgi:hypothetical protein
MNAKHLMRARLQLIHSVKAPKLGTGDPAGPADIGYSPDSQECQNRNKGQAEEAFKGEVAPCVSCSANTSIRLDGRPICGHCAEKLEWHGGASDHNGESASFICLLQSMSRRSSHNAATSFGRLLLEQQDLDNPSSQRRRTAAFTCFLRT